MAVPTSPAPPELPERNPRTHAAHRREVLYQITLPLIFMLLLFTLLLVGVVWSSVQGSAEVSRWADVSVIWLVAPKLLGAFIQLILLSAVTYGIYYLIKVLPPYFRIAQDFMLRVQIRTRRISNQVTEPFLKLAQVRAYLNAWRSKLTIRKDTHP